MSTTPEHPPVEPQSSESSEASLPLVEGGQPAEARRVSVAISKAELAILDDLGPKNEKVQKWMTDNGVVEGDLLELRTPDGLRVWGVYITDSEDFLTKDRALSGGAAEEMSAATAAKAILDIENLVDAKTGEMQAQVGLGGERHLPLEDVIKVGEEGVESAERSAGVDILPPEEQERPAYAQEQAAVEFQAEVAIEVRRAEAVLQEASIDLQRGAADLRERAEDSIGRLGGAMRHIGDYPVSSVQKMLQETIKNLEQAVMTGRKYSQGTIGEASSMVKGVAEGLAAQREQAAQLDKDFEPEEQVAAEQKTTARSVFESTAGMSEAKVAAVTSDLLVLDQAAKMLTSRDLGQGAHLLKEVLDQSRRHGRIDPESIVRVLTGIKRTAAEGGPFDQAVQKVRKTISQ